MNMTKTESGLTAGIGVFRNFQIIKRRCDDMKYCDFEKLAYLCQKYGFKTMGDIVLFLKKHDLNIYEFFEILKKGGEKVENAF
jgi:hypothetical protein